MKTAIYARVSSESQAREGTIQSQLGAARSGPLFGVRGATVGGAHYSAMEAMRPSAFRIEIALAGGNA